MLSDGMYNNKAIKSTMSQDVASALGDFLNDESDYDLDDKYIGKVVDNNDPLKKGRCRIRVFGVFGPEVQDNQLPWALQDESFIGGLKGSSIIPPVDCIVSVYFERGEIYLPRFTRKVIDENNLPTNMGEDYPDNMVFYETDNGDKFEINRKKETTKFEHSSGTTITIDKNGTINIDSKSDINVTHSKNLFVDGSYVQPEATGPLCALPTCLFTGAPHVGRTCLPNGAPLPSATTAEEEATAILGGP